MVSIPYARGRALQWAAVALAGAGLWWYVQSYRPAAAELASRERAVVEREGRIRAARAAAVVHGPAGLDTLIEQFRADSLVLATRVPAVSEAEAAAAEIKDALARAERLSGVRVTATEPLPATMDGGFQTAGFTVRLVGRYEDAGVLLADVASLPRLVRTRGLRLHAIPDSLVRGAEPYGAAGAAAAAQADSSGTAAALADAGETPFRASVTFDLVWYTLPPPESSAADSAAAGSSFAAGAQP